MKCKIATFLCEGFDGETIDKFVEGTILKENPGAKVILHELKPETYRIGKSGGYELYTLRGVFLIYETSKNSLSV